MKPQVIGRDPELGTLTRALDRPGGTILLRGEAGIGKSALAQHTLDLAEQRGLTVLHGQAHPLHAGLAYAPIVAAVRPLLAKVTEMDGLTHLGRLMADPRLPTMAPTDNPELDRTQMFEAVARLVERHAPAVFFIDDLHWADRGTIELVHYLGRNTQNVLTLAAYRPGEANPTLEDLATTVRRNGTELSLAPLTDDDVAQIAHNLLGEAPEPRFLEDVTQRAKGVPLFVTALVQGGFQAVPTIVRDVVLGRLQRLDEPERRLLETVAVAGEAATDAVLKAVSDVAAALRNLIVDGLVVERPVARAITYRVAHPLYAEVAYAEMTLSERRALHGAVLAAIEQTDPDDTLALAPHYREAGNLADPARAVAVMAEAGWRALAVRAAEEAVRYLEAAMELAEPQQQPDLLDGIGRAHMNLGDMDAATAAWTTGIRLADRLGLDKALAVLRFRLAMLDSERLDSAMANSRLWTQLRDIPLESPEIAIQSIIYTLRHGTLADVHTLSASLAESIGPGHPAHARAVAHFGQAVCLLIDQKFKPALIHAQDAVTQAKRCEAELPFYAQYFQLFLSALSALNGDVAMSIDCARETVSAGTLVELPSLKCFEHYALSFGYYLAGDLANAFAEIDTGVGVAKESGMPRSISRVLAFRAFMLAEQGKLTEATAALAEAEQSYRSPEQSLVEVVALASTAIALYDNEPLPSIPFDASQTYSDPVATMLRMLYAGLCGLNNGQSSPAAECAASLREFDQPAALMIAIADRLDGLCLHDADLLARTADAFDGMGAALLAAQARLEQYELSKSAPALPQVLEVFDKAGAAHWANRARQLARTLGIRVRAPRRDGPLTARESDVVRLLGEGLSNADIAARLFLSGRTVETHLRNSYAKLGLTTRVALARWAAENL
ncbi:helix-turn-helix transcriptional regulator [Kibdelosporangium aridum]|uniref:Helix-turn-helix transcriptional regulator n=1 Tax=Kibdelosporangium aridum TaxID=2030 RepID=A0A428ZR33_KIBAR|nr:helix-turn-helix transcriptional regulator [Kibdelosporangium aridum]RSM90526.1 helix-turn-helix transcriptional regulator [Kibdelosporangium aridum]